jgi:hypothetical protein
MVVVAAEDFCVAMELDAVKECRDFLAALVEIHTSIEICQSPDTTLPRQQRKDACKRYKVAKGEARATEEFYKLRIEEMRANGCERQLATVKCPRMRGNL